MGKRLPDRERRRKAFLRALALGVAPGAAAAGAGLARSTLYAWRRDGPRFRAAWDRAAAAACEMHEALFESALIERALAGVEVPVVRQGRIVGTRRRYDDRTLMLAYRWLHARRAEAAPPRPERAAPVPAPGDVVTEAGNVTVVLRRFGEDWKPEAERGREPVQAGLTDRAGADPPPRHLAQRRVDP